MFMAVDGRETTEKIELIAKKQNPAITKEAVAENCRYMRLKIGSMPFLHPFGLRDDSTLYVGCRSLYGKHYRGKMISSAETFRNLLSDDLHVVVEPCWEGEVEDAVRISGAVPMELIQACMERLEMFTSEIIQ